ncbi:DUF4184 family protein [Ferruginibacter sp.]
MPFTFSHPAVVLPFCNVKKMCLSFTGLVAGSIIPDVEFLLRLRNTENLGHTWYGIFLIDMPMAIVFSFIFHNLIRDIMVLHLPAFFRQRLSLMPAFNWTEYFKQHKLIVLLSIFIGILSHLILDVFTHKNKLIGHIFKPFNSELMIGGHAVHLYFILQVGFSILGLLYMLWFVCRMEKQVLLPAPPTLLQYWISLLLIAVLLFAVRVVVDRVHQSSDDIIIAATGSLVYALLIVSVYYFKKQKAFKKISPAV